MKIILFIFTITLFLQAESISNKNYGNAIVENITLIYDGDTFKANIKGYPDIVGHRIGIRVDGYARN